MRGADGAVMTGFDHRLSYREPLVAGGAKRKFLLLATADGALAFTLPAWGGRADAGADRRADLLAAGLILALVPLDGATLWLLLVGVLTIIVFSVSRDPQMLLASIRLSAFSMRISTGLAVAGRPSGAARRRWRPCSGWCLVCRLSPSWCLALQRGRVPRLLTEPDPADLALHFYSVRRGDGDSPCANFAFWLW